MGDDKTLVEPIVARKPSVTPSVTPSVRPQAAQNGSSAKKSGKGKKDKGKKDKGKKDKGKGADKNNGRQNQNQNQSSETGPPQNPDTEKVGSENGEEDMEMVRSKSMPLQPDESSDEFICGNVRNENIYDVSRIPFSVRLNATRKSALDYVFDGIPKPKGWLPEKQMPGWFDYPFSKKLPTVPAPKEYLYYSRGVLGEQLHRPNVHYTNYDPYNRELVVSTPYSILHDKNTLGFYNKPIVHDKLVQDGLVSKTNKAICSLEEFNKYRNYLYKRIFVEDVNEVLNDKDIHQAAMHDMIRTTKQEIDAIEGKAFKKNQRIKNAQELRRNGLMNRLIVGIQQQKQAEKSTKRYLDIKKNVGEERRVFNQEQEKIRRANIEKNERKMLDAKAVLLKDIAAGDKANSDRWRHDRGLVRRAHKQFQLEWTSAKFDYQNIMVKKQKLVTHTLDYNAQTNAVKRQEKVEAHRKHMPQIIARRKEAYKRLWDIVRKYFNRWRDNVRKRKERRPDAMHISNWDIPVVLDKTCEYLRKESGYEKLDDFIMGIVALKKRIKAELDAEEAEEAAALAAAAAAGPRPETPGAHEEEEGSHSETPPT